MFRESQLFVFMKAINKHKDGGEFSADVDRFEVFDTFTCITASITG